MIWSRPVSTGAANPVLSTSMPSGTTSSPGQPLRPRLRSPTVVHALSVTGSNYKGTVLVPSSEICTSAERGKPGRTMVSSSHWRSAREIFSTRSHGLALDRTTSLGVAWAPAREPWLQVESSVARCHMKHHPLSASRGSTSAKGRSAGSWTAAKNSKRPH